MSSDEEVTQISLQLQGLTICVTRSRIPPDSASAPPGSQAGPVPDPSGLSHLSSGTSREGSSASPSLGLGVSLSPGPVCSAPSATSRSGLDGFPSPEPVCSAPSAASPSGLGGFPSPYPVCGESGSDSTPASGAGPTGSASQVPLAGPCGQDSAESVEGTFPPVPPAWLSASRSLRASGHTGKDRIERAWVAGCWVREVLAGRARTPRPAPRLSLASRFYAVARSLLAVGNPQHHLSLCPWTLKQSYRLRGDLWNSSFSTRVLIHCWRNACPPPVRATVF